MITAKKYALFLNDVAVMDDVHHACEATMPVQRCGKIGNYHYDFNDENKEALIVSLNWFDAARYCNWKNNKNVSRNNAERMTESGAYVLNGDRLMSIENGASFVLPNNKNQRDGASISCGALLGFWGDPQIGSTTAFPVYGVFNATSYVDPQLHCNEVGLSCALQQENVSQSSGEAVVEGVAGDFIEEVLEGFAEGVYVAGMIAAFPDGVEVNREFSNEENLHEPPLYSQRPRAADQRDLLLQNTPHHGWMNIISNACRNFSAMFRGNRYSSISPETGHLAATQISQERGPSQHAALELEKNASVITAPTSILSTRASSPPHPFTAVEKKEKNVSFAQEIDMGRPFDERQRDERWQRYQNKYAELLESNDLFFSAVPDLLKRYDEETHPQVKKDLLQRASELKNNPTEKFLVNIKKFLNAATLCRDYQNSLATSMNKGADALSKNSLLEKIETVESNLFSTAQTIFNLEKRIEALSKNAENLKGQGGGYIQAEMNACEAVIHCAQGSMNHGFACIEHLQDTSLANLEYDVSQSCLEASNCLGLLLQRRIENMEVKELANKAAEAAYSAVGFGELLIEDRANPLLLPYYQKIISYFKSSSNFYMKGDLVAAEASFQAANEMEKALSYIKAAINRGYEGNELVRECYTQAAEYSVQKAEAIAKGNTLSAANLTKAISTLDSAGKSIYKILLAVSKNRIENAPYFYEKYKRQVAIANAYAEGDLELAAELEKKETAAAGEEERSTKRQERENEGE